MTMRLLLTVSFKFEIRGPNDLCSHSIHEMFSGELKDHDEEGQISSCYLLSAKRFALIKPEKFADILNGCPLSGNNEMIITLTLPWLELHRAKGIRVAEVMQTLFSC